MLKHFLLEKLSCVRKLNGFIQSCHVNSYLKINILKNYPAMGKLILSCNVSVECFEHACSNHNIIANIDKESFVVICHIYSIPPWNRLGDESFFHHLVDTIHVNRFSLFCATSGGQYRQSPTLPGSLTRYFCASLISHGGSDRQVSIRFAVECSNWSHSHYYPNQHEWVGVVLLSVQCVRIVNHTFPYEFHISSLRLADTRTGNNWCYDTSQPSRFRSRNPSGHHVLILFLCRWIDVNTHSTALLSQHRACSKVTSEKQNNLRTTRTLPQAEGVRKHWATLILRAALILIRKYCGNDWTFTTKNNRAAELFSKSEKIKTRRLISITV